MVGFEILSMYLEIGPRTSLFFVIFLTIGFSPQSIKVPFNSSIEEHMSDVFCKVSESITSDDPPTLYRVKSSNLLHTLFKNPSKDEEPHCSLSRPFVLREHQIEPFIGALRSELSNHLRQILSVIDNNLN